MNRICRKCDQEKHITSFVKRSNTKGKIVKTPPYVYTCKECAAKAKRTNKENTGRFKKGHTGGKHFPKGHIPWSKLNKGTYFFERKCTTRGSANYNDWVKKAKERDFNKCRECDSIKFLEVHHIYSYEEYPDKRCELSNGITLCRSCHKKIEGMMKRLKRAKITWD